MIFMETNLSSKQICSIIVTSAKAGVAELEFGPLKVRFGRPVEQRAKPLQMPLGPTALSTPEAELSEDDHRMLSKEGLEHETARIRDEKLARALIEDPELYEQLIRDEELGDALDASDDAADE